MLSTESGCRIMIGRCYKAEMELSREEVSLLTIAPNMSSTTTTTTTQSQDPSLAGHDEEQIRLMEERCIVLDNDDKYIRDGSKKECK